MKRRDFLKSVFGVAAGLAVAPSVVKAKPKQHLMLGGQRAGKSEKWLRTPEEVKELKVEKKAALGDGLENAFCYGGKLFRVYPGYFVEGFTMMQLREGPFHNREFNYMLANEDYNNIHYRYCICEFMLKTIDK